MEENKLFLILAILTVMAALTAIAFMVPAYRRSREAFLRAVANRDRDPPTYFLDEGDCEKSCGICCGEIGGERLSECPCGRVFHASCAGPTGRCPYCGAPFEAMESRDPSAPPCPVCGGDVEGSVCPCGAAYPRRDGFILCACGGRVDPSRPVCRMCGAAYERIAVRASAAWGRAR
ncbi:MAG: hypothetical protein LBG62_01990 [Candidatus Methanoplasma sp.]|jgi:hypothetical protein|nr:hypothetical protein [Candidatus Methanoplasma sp.]